jgi:uncharacterized protein (DUF2141 family)
MTRSFVLAAAFAALASSAAAGDGAATLNITVQGVGDAGGQLRIGVYDQAGFGAKNALPVAGKVAPARPGKTTVRIENIPPGVYGVKLFQDIDGNGYLDFGMRGVEPVGFSNDPPVTTGLPAFDDAKFTLSPGDNSITVTLH